MNDVNKKIKEQIESKKIKMKSKSYYLALSILYFVSVIVVILFTLFLASFIFFALKSSGTNEFLAFGYAGLLPFFQSIPWLLILALIILILLVELFGKKIDLVSKKPLVYSLAAVIIVVVGFGAVFAETPIHNTLLDKAAENRLPLGKGMYEKYGSFRENDLIVAKIIEINDEFLLVESQENQFKVELSDELRKPDHVDLFVNQEIIIFGEINDDSIEAKGIKPFDGPKPRYRGKNIIIDIQRSKTKVNSI